MEPRINGDSLAPAFHSKLKIQIKRQCYGRREPPCLFCVQKQRYFVEIAYIFFRVFQYGDEQRLPLTAEYGPDVGFSQNIDAQVVCLEIVEVIVIRVVNKMQGRFGGEKKAADGHVHDYLVVDLLVRAAGQRAADFLEVRPYRLLERLGEIMIRILFVFDPLGFYRYLSAVYAV
jgi:hypothetical protein